MRDISTEEYLSISRTLEDHHALFYMAWKMGRPWFDESIETACVRFDKEGDFIQFAFNPDFWDSLDDYNKAFVISHECLHVILNHGMRTKSLLDNRRCNVALDLVVNHSLVNNFGFDRTRIKDWEQFCWVDTVFKPEDNVPDDKYFEYYYQMIHPTKKMGVRVLDDHSGLGGIDWDSVLDKLGEGLSDQEKSNIREMLEGKVEGLETDQMMRGDGSGGMWRTATTGPIKKKKKWETIIKKWSKRYDKPEFKDMEQWARINRRFVMLADDLLLPTDMEVEDDYEKNKIEVWFFQDTSGSCSGYINRFFTAAESLPEDRFDIKLHCFDTRVFETTLESKKLFGFGGTSFHILEDYIQQYIKKNEVPYPEAVFVITDGFGTKVFPKKPENWHWFLTTNYTSCIPSTCNIYNLRDYE